MAKTSLQQQINQNHRNTRLIIFVFILMMAAIGGIFAWLNSNPRMVLYFVAVAALYAGVQYYFADKLAIKSARAVEIQPQENPRFYKIITDLANEAKIPMPKVYIVNDAAPNAFATGRDPEHACVAATTGLLDIMDDRELRAVMGHELSHVKNFDIRVTMIVFGLVSLAGLLSQFGMRVLYDGGRDDESSSPIGVLIAMIVLILSPIIASLVQLGVSRQREYLADASSANLINSPDDMIAALRKLDSHAQPMHQQNMAAESLYIANPLRKGLLNNLFSTHPSIESRIGRLEDAKN